MAEKIDPVRERERLAKRYAAMSVLELEKMGEEPESLTEWARQALKEEMDTRGVKWLPDAVSVKAKSILDAEMLVPFRTYNDRIAALSDRSVLQSAGIETLFLNENQSSLGWGAAHSIEIKLMVHSKDLEAARQFLEHRAVLDLAEGTKDVESGRVADELAGKTVVLRTYRDLPAALVAKSVLDAAGIRCFLQDDNVVRMDWMWSNAVGGIKLVVSDRDAEDASKILNSSQDELPANREQ